MSEASPSTNGAPQERGSDALFAKLALERGFVTREQIADARAMQEKVKDLGLAEPLQQILVVRGAIGRDEAEELAASVAITTGEARLIAGYEVIEKLGQGGMGAVYKAQKSDTGQIVALKLLPPSLATEVNIARFRLESAVTAKLGHPNIVGCVEFGRDHAKDVYFCALEFVEGEDVWKVIQRMGHIPEAEAVGITRQIAMALQHAHFCGLVHRDVKPANIMVMSNGTAKLLDLGLARPADAEELRLTQTGVFVGSPHYVSPEQATGNEIDTRGDIYSLGATLYHMLTGRPPYDGKSSMAILQMQVSEMLPWPADIVPELSYEVCLMVAKMMAKAPADRYQVPKELLADLDALAKGNDLAFGDEVLRNSAVRPAVEPRRKARRKRPPTQCRGEAAPKSQAKPRKRERTESAAPRKRSSTRTRAKPVTGPKLDRIGKREDTTGSGRARAGTSRTQKTGTGLEPIVTYWNSMPQTTRIGLVTGAASFGVVLLILLMVSGSERREVAPFASSRLSVSVPPPVIRVEPRAERPVSESGVSDSEPLDAPAAGLRGAPAAVSAGEAIWIEGEAPSKHDFERHPWWYEQVDYSHLSGQRWLSHFKSGDGPVRAEYEFRVDEPGTYTLWLRCNVNSVAMDYQLDDRERQPVPMDAPLGSIVLHRLLRTVAWVKVGRLELGRGPHKLAYHLFRNKTCAYPPGENHGGIDCMCLASSPEYVPSGTVRPVGAKVIADTIPEGWMQQDVGIVVSPGRAHCSAGRYEITGSGFDGYGSNFHYVYKKVTGDFKATVRVESLSKEKWSAFAALTVLDRVNVDPSNLKRVAIGMRHYGVAELFTGITDKSLASLKAGLPRWLKMVRAGNTFSAYIGASGDDWTMVGTTDVQMPREICVGLSVGSSDFRELSTGIFEEPIIYEE